MDSTAAPPILLYDGTCGFCHATIRLILRHERRHDLRFVPLQSELGQKLLAQHSLPMDPETVVLLTEDGRSHVRSNAALGVWQLMGGSWPALACIARFVPRILRDLVYRAVASTRYRLFGRKQDPCEIPTPAQRARFLV